MGPPHHWCPPWALLITGAPCGPSSPLAPPVGPPHHWCPRVLQLGSSSRTETTLTPSCGPRAKLVGTCRCCCTVATPCLSVCPLRNPQNYFLSDSGSFQKHSLFLIRPSFAPARTGHRSGGPPVAHRTFALSSVISRRTRDFMFILVPPLASSVLGNFRRPRRGAPFEVVHLAETVHGNGRCVAIVDGTPVWVVQGYKTCARTPYVSPT